MSRYAAAGLVCLLVLTTATAALAGRPHERDGFVIGFNLGAGSANVRADEGEESDSGGAGGAFRLGWAFADQFMVGLESAAWVNTDLFADVTLSSGLVAFTWYPSARGFFVRTGLGSGKVSVTFDVPGLDVVVEEKGASFMLGAGHEWRLGGTFALGAALDYHTFSVDGGDFDFVNVTAQLNWYF